MAKIPTLGTATSIGKSAPTAQGPSISSAAVEGEALGRLAQNASNVAFSIVEKRKEAETSSYGDTASMEYSMGMAKYEAQARLNAKGDHKGYSDDIIQETNRRREEYAANAPSTDARNHFLKKTDNSALSLGVGALNYETTARAKYGIKIEGEQGDNISSLAYDDPNPFKVSEQLADYQNNVLSKKGLVYTEAQANEIVDKTTKNARQGVFRGMLRDGLSGLVPEGTRREEAMARVDDFISGGVPGTEVVLAGVSDEEKAQFRDRAENVFNTRSRAQDGVLRILLKNSITALAEGKGQDPRNRDGINETWSLVRAMEEGPEKDLNTRSMINARKVGDVVEGLHHMSPQQMEARVNGTITGGSLFTKGVDDDATDMLRRAASAIITERNKDGRAYVDQYYPSTKNDPDAAFVLQKVLGITKPRILSKEDARLKSQAIMEASTSKEGAALFDEHLSMYGAHAPKAIAEMIDENPNVPPGLGLVVHFNNTLTKERLFDNMLPGKAEAISAQFEATRKGATDETNLALTKGLAKIDQIFYESGRPEQAKILRGLVETETKRSMLGDPTLGPKEAVARAQELIVGKEFHHYDTPSNQFLIPRQLGVEKVEVESYMSHALTPETLQASGFSKSRHLVKGNVRDEQEMWDQIKEYGVWKQTREKDGIRLILDTPTGDRRMLTNDGQPFIVKFKDMKNYRKPESKTLKGFDKFGRKLASDSNEGGL